MNLLMQWTLGVVLVVFATFSTGNELAEPGEVFYFSAGYRVDGAPAQNILQLGAIEPCAQAWCLRLRRYEGARNLPRIRTGFRHRMTAPFRSPRCTDEWITTINGEQLGPIRGALRATPEGWEFIGGGFRYLWARDPKLLNAYVLKEVKDFRYQAAADQVVGFAFRSQNTRNLAIRQLDLMHYFRGEIHHKNTLKGVGDNWDFQSSSIDFRKFSAIEEGNVLYLTQPGHPEVEKRLGKKLWVQHSVLLRREGDDLTPTVHEYGHDFNMNGCFDEFGHNKMLLPIVDGKGISAFIYVEYSPDKFDGVPMISVGRYYQ